MRKCMIYLCVCYYSPLFSARLAHKKQPAAYSHGVASKKSLKLISLHPPIIQAIRTGLTLSFKYVKGVFLMLNTCLLASFIPKNQHFSLI